MAKGVISYYHTILPQRKSQRINILKVNSQTFRKLFSITQPFKYLCVWNHLEILLKAVYDSNRSEEGALDSSPRNTGAGRLWTLL